MNSVDARALLDSEAKGTTATRTLGSAMRGGAISFGTSLTIQALNVLTGVVIARNLGPLGKGELAAIIIWPALVAVVVNLGLLDACAYYTARPGVSSSTVTRTTLILAGVLGAIGAFAGWWLVPLALGHDGSGVIRLSQMYLVWIPVNLLSLTTAASLQGTLSFVAYNACRLNVVAWTALGLVALAAAHRFSVQGALGVYIVANLLTLALGIILAWKHGLLPGKFDPGLCRPLLSYGIKSHVGNFSSLANQRGDQLLISAFLPPFDLGIYTVAVSLSAAVNLIGTSIQTITLPFVSRIADGRERSLVLGRFVRLTLVGSAAAAFALGTLVPILIDRFFGPAFMPATIIARLLLLASVVLGTNLVIGAGLRALGMPLGAGAAETVAAVVTVASLLVLLPTIGLAGAALASLLAYLTSTIVMLWTLQVRAGIAWTDLLVPRASDVAWGIALARRLGARSWPSGAAS